MPSPEIQRVLLLIGLAITGYLLVLAWNAEYRQTELPPEIGERPTLPDDRPPDVAPVDPMLPIDPIDPDAPAEPVAPVEPAEDIVATRPEDRLIEVRTRTQNVWIDRHGGDIVRLELPRYPVSLERADVPFLLLDSAPGRLYLAQSYLRGPQGIDESTNRLTYDAPQRRYDFTETGGGSVRLTTTTGSAEVAKLFRFHEDDYLIDVSYEVGNRTEEPVRIALFAEIRRGDHAAPGAGAPIGLQPYLGAALTKDDERYVKLRFRDLQDDRFQEDVHGGWMAMLQHYFLSAWVANPDEQNRFFGYRRPDETYVVGYASPWRTVPPGTTTRIESRFYAGPKDQDRLQEIAPHLNLTVDYGFLWWLAVPLFQLLSFLQGIFGNWGVSIIMLTVVIKAVLYPLSAASFRSMANMRRVAPQIKRLQERYGDDRQRLSQEMMALYKKEKANPLGGCLPMLLQMPVFIALYWVLFESVELRHAPFVLWINDLSAMDPYFVLPILMGVSMFVQMSLNPPVPDPMQAKIMKMMPIVFTALFLFFPAGLVLYWFTNNVISVAQQWLINRQVEGARAAAKG